MSNSQLFQVIYDIGSDCVGGNRLTVWTRMFNQVGKIIYC